MVSQRPCSKASVVGAASRYRLANSSSRKLHTIKYLFDQEGQGSLYECGLYDIWWMQMIFTTAKLSGPVLQGFDGFGLHLAGGNAKADLHAQ